MGIDLKLTLEEIKDKLGGDLSPDLTIGEIDSILSGRLRMRTINSLMPLSLLSRLINEDIDGKRDKWKIY